MGILLGPAFIDRFVREIWPYERKNPFLNLQPVALLVRKTQKLNLNPINSIITELREAERVISDEKRNPVVRVEL